MLMFVFLICTDSITSDHFTSFREQSLSIRETGVEGDELEFKVLMHIRTGA